MKVLVNATNLRVGGGVQKAVEFVRASVSYHTGHTFSYALSDTVAANLQAVAKLDARKLMMAETSPARPLAGRTPRSRLGDLEQSFRPDVVFSIFGPAYKAFRAPHLMGFAVPWVTHPNEYAWLTIQNPIARARQWAWCKHTAMWARLANRWVLETEVAADGLSRALGVDRACVDVVPNAPSQPYRLARESGVSPDGRMKKEADSDVHLLVFSAWYPHKNLEIIPRVAMEARRLDAVRRYRFFLTLDPDSAPWRRLQSESRRLGVGDRVVNLGTIPVREGPGLYAAADALFLPTLLESFTATYPEAMCMRRPIVTSDLPFAHDLCGQAALYCPPNDAAGAARQIVRLAASRSLQDDLIARGDEIFAESKSPREIFDMFISILEGMAGAGDARTSAPLTLGRSNVGGGH